MGPEKHQNQAVIARYIATRVIQGHPSVLPGTILAMSNCRRDDMLPCDGRRLHCGIYTTLYMAIGDTYCPKTISEPKYPPWAMKALAFLGVKKARLHREVANPDYKSGYFRLPKLA